MALGIVRYQAGIGRNVLAKLLKLETDLAYLFHRFLHRLKSVYKKLDAFECKRAIAVPCLLFA